MIVRQFLQWVRTAPAADRADATSALARAYLYSDLSKDDRIAAEGAMLILLDDPSPLVREALAQALAAPDRRGSRRPHRRRRGRGTGGDCAAARAAAPGRGGARRGRLRRGL